ncbi:DUF2267 domain-containing protein [Streptomyces albogriseolus]|uniref:DUF2267 domain-containing protein n=1 Tax=Streptomyces albogriseolus TaxID=1887 RepID=UPI00380FA7F4
MQVSPRSTPWWTRPIGSSETSRRLSSGPKNGVRSRTRHCGPCCTRFGIVSRSRRPYQFGAQLPTLVGGVYYDGWRPADTPVKMSNEEFFARVRSEFPQEVTRAVRRQARPTAPGRLPASRAPSGSCGHGSGGCHSNIKIVASSLSSLC